MGNGINRRGFMKGTLLTSAGGAFALQGGAGKVLAQGEKNTRPSVKPQSKAELPMGKIKDMQVSRMLLGGNLLTHYTHSRDLRYVYNLTAHYNTDEKIFETMAEAEAHGINTLVIHTAPRTMDLLTKYRSQWGGKIQWIICPTAPIDDSMKAYAEQVKKVVEDGVDAIYLWGVRSDVLAAQGKVGLIAKAVEIAKDYGIPSGVGAHDLQAIKACEEHKVPADFYIKTMHHHNYPTAPKPDELEKPIAEVPGYWCQNPQEVIDFMQTVEKPWIAFKVMAAGAIHPKNAFPYVFEKGADHVLAGMFDFEIAEDVNIVKAALNEAKKKRVRPWRS